MAELTERWQAIFADLAVSIAKASKDPSTKVGCVIYRPDKSIAGMGFNGFPRGFDDDPALYADREYKLQHIVHAEENAIENAPDIWLGGYGIVCTFLPCKKCAEKLALNGIKTVYYLKASKEAEERWAESFAASREVFRKFNITAIEINPTITST